MTSYEYTKQYRKLYPMKRYLERKEYYEKTAYSSNYGKTWTDEELEMVMKHEITDSELSQKLGRSVASIQMKRSITKKKIRLIKQIVGGAE